MFFYLYCFIGWIWETFYVSILEGHWVNRGFMHGPFLPIYGFGFTGMVMLTSNLRGIYWAEAIVGMIGATIMEYFTGLCMEKFFKVRYWDYSNNKFNLNGYICLQASLCWAIFAILGPEVAHPVVEKFVLGIPEKPLEIIVILLTAGVSADFSGSFKEALDFKEVLITLTERNEELAKIERGVIAVSEFVNGDLKETTEAGLRKINSTFTDGKNAYLKKTEQISELKDRLVDTMEKIKSLPENISLSNFPNAREELEEDMKKLSLMERAKATMKNKRSVKKSFRIIKRNPDVASKEYEAALEELKNEM